MTGDASEGGASRHLGRELRVVDVVVLPGDVRPEVGHQPLPPRRSRAGRGAVALLNSCDIK